MRSKCDRDRGGLVAERHPGREPWSSEVERLDLLELVERVGDLDAAAAHRAEQRLEQVDTGAREPCAQRFVDHHRRVVSGGELDEHWRELEMHGGDARRQSA